MKTFHILIQTTLPTTIILKIEQLECQINMISCTTAMWHLNNFLYKIIKAFCCIRFTVPLGTPASADPANQFVLPLLKGLNVLNPLYAYFWWVFVIYNAIHIDFKRVDFNCSQSSVSKVSMGRQPLHLWIQHVTLTLNIYANTLTLRKHWCICESSICFCAYAAHHNVTSYFKQH